MELMKGGNGATNSSFFIVLYHVLLRKTMHYCEKIIIFLRIFFLNIQKKRRHNKGRPILGIQSRRLKRLI